MNREIKFRGKSIMNNTCGDWLYSSGIKYGDDVELMYCDEDTSEEWNYVDKETVGQYTGLNDKNGKEIYEGDIVRINDKIIAKVIWDKDYLEYFLYANEENSIDSFENGEQPLYDYFGGIEVVGNIYDNPELLGGEQR